jgi:hypothetical protein
VRTNPAVPADELVLLHEGATALNGLGNVAAPFAAACSMARAAPDRAGRAPVPSR